MIFFDSSSSDEESANIVINKIVRRELRDKSNPFELSNEEFSKNFRINKECLRMILEYVEFQVGIRETAISPMLQLCATLHLLATGSYQVNVGFNRSIAMAQTTVSKFFRSTLQCLEDKLCPQYIKFDEQTFADCRNHFYSKYKLPGVVGCVDGTHVPLLKPTNNEHVFYNRKGFHSLNVMIVCDNKNKIIYIDSSNGGASHDSFVWSRSHISNYLREKYEENSNIRLLGDSGYPLLPWLLTPYRNAAEGSNEIKFNLVHSKARSIVERTIGILKCRWRCLSSERKLRFPPEIVAKVVNVCAALHNICVEHNVNIDFDIPEVERETGVEGTSEYSNDNMQRRAVGIRDRIRDSL